MRKIRIAFILSEYGLPIPAKMGGAIETLMTMLLEQNEIEGKFDFLFISPGKKEEKEEFDHAICYSPRTHNLRWQRCRVPELGTVSAHHDISVGDDRRADPRYVLGSSSRTLPLTQGGSACGRDQRYGDT